MAKPRVGFYCWAGPDTIRMINLKFFNPGIDKESIMGSYEYDYLAQLKETFGVTDFWAMYSWGFSNRSERKQREFLIERIPHFKKLGIKLHAYVQGPNVVTADFPKKDWYVRDNKGRNAVYYRGRLVTCLNNPEFRTYKLKVIEEMAKLPFDGVYMDNIQMGQYGLLRDSKGKPLTFAGCTCEYCIQDFQKQHGREIPLDPESEPKLTQVYLDYRTSVTTKF